MLAAYCILFPVYSVRMYDVAIIGLGCAGYTAAIYAARYKLTTLLVGELEGGTGIAAVEVGNWPGDIEITGTELMERMRKHAVSFDAVTHKVARIEKVEKEGETFLLTFQNGETAQARTVIFATGSKHRHLGVPGEEEYAGKGVSYCATCDAFFYRGKTVAVIGGGDSAVEGAAIVAQVAKKVYLIHRRDAFRAEPYWVDRVKGRPNVEFVLSTNVTKITGEQTVKAIELNTPFNGSKELSVDGVFVEIGAIPETKLAADLGCVLDDRGHLKVDSALQTTVPGVFAAGDVSGGSNHFAQFATAAGEGAIVGNSAFNYLSNRGEVAGGSMGGG